MGHILVRKSKEESTMPKVEQHIKIDRPVEEVFSLIADQPEQIAAWWPTFDLQQRITPAPTKTGSVLRYVYDMMGIRIKGQQQVQEFVRNERLITRTISGFDSIFDFQFQALGRDTTVLTIIFDYRLPGALLSQLFSRAAIEFENAKSLNTALINPKQRLERTIVG